MQEKKIKTKYNRKFALILELIIWFLFLILAFCGFCAHKYYVNHNYSRYQLFLQDVDGIIVGSPVKMLGIPIGYVKNLKPINDTVFVDFILTEKGMKIPKGSVITVEFSGLASSKSLEIYPPKTEVPKDTPVLVIQQPRRLGAALGLLDEMFHKVGQIIFTCTRFGEELASEINNIEKLDSNISENTKNKKSPKESLQNIEQFIDEKQKFFDKKAKRYE